MFFITSIIKAVQCIHDLNMNGDLAMLSTGNFKDGGCPYLPGKLDSRVKDSFDYSKLQGTWKDIYDIK